MSDLDVLRALLTAPETKKTRYWGDQMFRLKTETGFPPDMFLSELRKAEELTEEEENSIVNRFLQRNMEHRTNGGVTDERLKKVRQANVAIMKRFIEKREIGV